MIIALVVFLVGLGSVNGQYDLPKCESGFQYLQDVTLNCSTIYWYQRTTNSSDAENYYKYYVDLCGYLYDLRRDCELARYVSCDSALKSNITRWHKEQKEELCDGEQVKEDIKKIIPDMIKLLVQSNESCWYRFVSNPTDLLDCGLAASSLLPGNDTAIYLYMDHFSRAYDSYIKCLGRVMKTHNCTNEDITAFIWSIKSQVQAGIKISVSAEDFENVETPRYGPRSTVMAFGDPHIKQYKKSIISCTAQGERLYLRNNYIRIKATNSFWPGSNVATIITDLRIEFTSDAGIFATYNASNSQLPASFTNGQNSVTQGGQTVKITLNNLYNFATIVNEESGTLIYIRKYKHTYPMLLVRMSDSVFDSSVGLFVDGCPDQIDLSAARRKRSTDECNSMCDDGDEEYQGPCRFDCSVTGGDTELASVTTELKKYEKAAETTDTELSDGGLDGDLDGGPGGAAAPVKATHVMTLLLFLVAMSQ